MRTKKILLSLTVLMSVLLTFTGASVSAEDYYYDDDDDMTNYDLEEEMKNYIESGDYKYSLKTYDDGEGVVLQEYLGADTKVEIPSELDGYPVKALGNRTFYEKEKITEITIPATLEDFGYYPFYGCTSLMEFKVDEKNDIYTSDSDGALVGKAGEAIMAFPTGKNPEKYDVPEGVMAINSSAFAMCTNLTEITFPDSLIFMGSFAFSECTSLKSVELPDSLTELGKFCFSSCTSLRHIKLPETLTSIGDAAFFKCTALTDITLPETLTEIGQAAFCSTGLTYINIPASVSSIGYSAFGYHTDLSDQFVADDYFLITGYQNTIAQSYAKENNLDFTALSSDEEGPTQITGKNSSKKPVTPGAAVGICLVCLIAIGIVVLAVVTKSKNNADDDDDRNDDYDTEDEE